MTQGPFPILLADDDPDDRLLTRRAFEQARLRNRLVTVSDGAELMDFLHRRGDHADAPRPGLILLDLAMPRKTGLEALAEIKTDPNLRSIPVVVLTTSRAEEDVVGSYDMGAASFISKPVTFQGLVEAVAVFSRYWVELVETP